MTHIEQRADTAANWAIDNPILNKGEVGWITDALPSPKCKLGDGVSHFSDLPISSPSKADLGLGSVDNTDDLHKPISLDTQAALNQKAPSNSPTFTGNPTVPTPATGDDDLSVANTAFVHDAIADAVAAAMLAMHPVGDIKMTTVNTNPGSYLGGTWVAWGAGRVPVGVDAAQTEFDTVEETGGEKRHTLTAQELPDHAHGSPKGTGATTGSSSDTNARSNDGAPVAGFRTTATIYSSGGFNSTAITGDRSHNNLQPYITCYMWKRTA